MHAKEPKYGKYGNDGLQRNIVACKDKEIDNINILVSNLELHPLTYLIELELMGPQLLF